MLLVLRLPFVLLKNLLKSSVNLSHVISFLTDKLKIEPIYVIQ